MLRFIEIVWKNIWSHDSKNEDSDKLVWEAQMKFSKKKGRNKKVEARILQKHKKNINKKTAAFYFL